jgi:drug/metabolite transporter (DMT)-like permease
VWLLSGVDCGKSVGWGGLLFMGVVCMIVGMCCMVFCMHLYI